MADPIFESGLEAFKLIVTALVYIAIFVNIFTRKGNDQLYFIAVLLGYFFIVNVINDFFLATTFIAMWFVLIGVSLFIPREALIGIFIVMLFLDYSNPIFFLLAIAVYTITTTNFLFSSFRRLGKEKQRTTKLQ